MGGAEPRGGAAPHGCPHGPEDARCQSSSTATAVLSPCRSERWPTPAQEVSLFNSQGEQIPRGQLLFGMSSEYDSLNAASYCNDGKFDNGW